LPKGETIQESYARRLDCFVALRAPRNDGLSDRNPRAPREPSLLWKKGARTRAAYPCVKPAALARARRLPSSIEFRAVLQSLDLLQRRVEQTSVASRARFSRFCARMTDLQKSKNCHECDGARPRIGQPCLIADENRKTFSLRGKTKFEKAKERIKTSRGAADKSRQIYAVF
jgi:hypothetical protein